MTSGDLMHHLQVLPPVPQGFALPGRFDSREIDFLCQLTELLASVPGRPEYRHDHQTQAEFAADMATAA